MSDNQEIHNLEENLAPGEGLNAREQQAERAIPHKKRRKYLLWFWLAFLFPIVSAILIFTLIAFGKLGFMPSFEELENPTTNLATELISSDGEILGTYFNTNRSKVEYADLAPSLINALIATEDIRFRDHSGIDARAIGRAVSGVASGGTKGGGSTITQQLAKMLFPRDDLNFIELIIRKLREWVIAVKLERSYTKDEIITLYLNKFDFNNLAVGIKTASRVYFKSTPDSLKIQEAAMLVGMAKNPSLFNPLRRPDTTLHRRNVVLAQMLKYGYLEQAEYDSVKLLPLGINYQQVDHKLGQATYFREYLRVTLNHSKPDRNNYWSYNMFKEDSAEWETNPLFGWCNKNMKADSTYYDLYKDGLKVFTTIDSRMQQYAEEAVAGHLGLELQDAIYKELRQHRYPPFSNDLEKEDADRIMEQLKNRCERYRVHKKNGLPKDTIDKRFNTPFPMKVFSWQGDIDTVMTPMDSINYYLHFLQAGFMSMDPHTGFVKAYVGGINYRHFKYDHVKVGKRQVGSTIKPFLYTIAMQEGYSPCDKVLCIPTSFTLADGTTWTPENAGQDEYEGKQVTLKWGLANSNNYISAWLMKQFNPDIFVKIMKKAGVKSYIDPVYSMILGTSDISLYEMVGAYSTFANKGIYTEPIFVTKIEDKHGNVISTFKPRIENVISEETAYLMLNLLMGVVREGSGVRLRYKYQMFNEIGGKTGTTDNHSDGWFMGVTPDLVSGGWVGGEVRSIHFEGLKLGQGANMALPIWALYMEKVYADSLNLGISKEDFEKPSRPYNFNLDCDKAGNNSKNNYDLNNYNNHFFN
ncbi:MAG: transglycosylase domain-containing protein [Bacteroidales bacterium]|nr:transglycosylase domain-containing protein [Bacteroidales bacterium]MCF8455372.1 transglycosylase domain-containing protein [Bacteroidales bacterium]